MAWGLPKLPGLTFPDPTKTQHHLHGSLKFYQGYRFPEVHVQGPGGAPTDVDSNAFALPEDPVNYDPSLTYGRAKQNALPAVVPRFVHYDKRCLNFKAFFKQPVYESPDEKYRVRIVNIIYFLEDDTLMVSEPQVRNSGIWQGRMVNRAKVPKNDMGECWHWKDLDVGKDICIYGRVYHTVSCDLFTKEWMESQGIEIAHEECIPEDEYVQKERWKNIRPPSKPKVRDDPLRRFLEYDGKVLTFDAVWDNRDSKSPCNSEMDRLRLHYFLQDDTICIKEIHDNKGGKDPFPQLLKKTKLPKNWKEKPVGFPSIVMETSEHEVTEYYSPRDLIVGETIFVLGRKLLLIDCDKFSRNYYRSMLNMEQPPGIVVQEEKPKEFVRDLPPHIGIGAPEDTIQSCFGLVPKPPHKDIIRYNLNANKYLRYLCELDWIHPEDDGRRFVLSYSLADGTIKIGEIPRRNSGIREGKFLASMRLPLPDSDPNFPTYYTPDRFFIGAVVPVFKHRFKIIGCDLFVYRYMSANSDKFPPEVLDNVRNYHMREGNLRDELEEVFREEQAKEMRSQLAKIGQAAVAEPSAMERCLTALNVVEGQATPPRPPTPPTTTDVIDYDDTIRAIRQSKQPCEGVTPLKGILKSGLPKDDQQKVVCFTGPAVDEQANQNKQRVYSYDDKKLYDDSADFCDQFRDPNWKERAEKRERDECAYEIIPSPKDAAVLEDHAEKPKLPGFLGTYNVDCKEIPDYMRLPKDAYEQAKKHRREVPEISPEAARLSVLPRQMPRAVADCKAPPPADEDPCAPKKPEDVSFACYHVEPQEPDCSANMQKS